MKRISLFVVALFCCSAAFAGAVWSSVTVIQFEPQTSQYVNSPNGLVFVKLSAAPTGGASCGSSVSQYGVIDVSSPGGMMTAAVLQAARLDGATLNVYGLGSCAVYSGFETIAYVIE